MNEEETSERIPYAERRPDGSCVMQCGFEHPSMSHILMNIPLSHGRSVHPPVTCRIRAEMVTLYLRCL